MTTGRKELLITIEQQREKIIKYENKISDLVRAYKSLVKEKEALQASLTILSENAPEQTVSFPSKKEEDSSEQTESSVVENESSENPQKIEENEIISLRNKVSTLTSTLQTLSDEKHKLEQSTKSERKRILEEKKQVEDQLKSEKEEWEKLKKDYELKLHDLRSKIIVFQHEREKEASNGIMMLREVENRLSKERNEKERIEKLLDETQEQNRQFALAIGTRTQEKKQQKQISDLQNELEQVRCRLKKAEEQCNEPPMLKILQDQMEQMKMQYMDAVLQEQKRAEAAEESVRKLSQTHEERVAALETNLSELSMTAAKHDKTKQSYIETIQNLKEKIAEIMEENQNLKSRSYVNSLNNEETSESVNAESLKKSFISIWNQLTQLKEFENESGYKKLEEFLYNLEVIHRKCNEDYKVLESKIEDMKHQSNKENDGSCRCGLKEQTEDLRERIRSLNHSNQMTQDLHERQVTSFKEEINKLRQSHQKELHHLEQEHRVTVSYLEQQLAEHCQRSLITLQDRDEEIHRLSQEIHKLKKEAQTQPSTVAAALLSQVSTGGSEGPLLHHIEDLARKELEVSQLRKEKIQLEKSMRDIQMTMIDKQQMMQDAIDDLHDEVERLKRNTSREGENLEYLKNVVLQYMTCSDAEARSLIFNAIAAVLKFTPAEIESVRKCLALWWWQAPDKRKNPNSKRSPSVSSISSSGVGMNFDLSSNRRSRFMSETDN